MLRESIVGSTSKLYSLLAQCISSCDKNVATCSKKFQKLSSICLMQAQPNDHVVRSKLSQYTTYFSRNTQHNVKLLWTLDSCLSRSLLPVPYKFTSRAYTTDENDAGFKNERESNGKSFALELILLFLCSSGIYTVWLYAQTTLVKPKDEYSGTQPLAWSTFYNVLVPSINAAKPLDDSHNFDLKGHETSNNHDKGGTGSRRQRFNFIADVLEIVQDAVVCIEVKDHSTTNWLGIPQGSSNGSGFIVKEDGLILTNAHVVASQQRNSITVKLHDGRCFAGFVEDVDYESDLATVRVKARGLPTLPLGCSSETRIGEWVVAVGSPLNLSNTVTAGVVSSTRRGANELGIQANDISYIQTDAAITFGNSGGPLINLDGEAIGINSMKVTPGISFAIPIDHAKIFLNRADMRRASGKSISSRRYMGLTILTLTDQIREDWEARTGFQMVNQGVLVWQVVRGGPAYLSGLQPGDVILNINGKRIKSAAQVHEIVKTDDELSIEVQRGGSKLTFIIVPENIM